MKSRDSEKLPAPIVNYSARDKRTLVLFLFALLLITVQLWPVSEPAKLHFLGIYRTAEKNEWYLVELSAGPHLDTAPPLVTGTDVVSMSDIDQNSLDTWPLELLLFFNRPIPINHANAEHLVRLPGIGPHRAAAIVDDREQRGAFSSPEDLLRVSGIGPKTLEQLLPLVYCAP